MMTNLKYWLKGLAVAAASMIIYAVALGCYMALMLLVISMEEGGDNLSAFSVPLTEALVLLSQGIGFKTDVITYARMASESDDLGCLMDFWRRLLNRRFSRIHIMDRAGRRAPRLAAFRYDATGG